jgi:putative dehydrogenase
MNDRTTSAARSAEPPKERMAVGVIGTGEMGSAVAKQLLDGGCAVAVFLAGRSPASRLRVRNLGLAGIETEREFAGHADLVLSIVPPAEARGAAARYCAALSGAPRRSTYVDCNAVAPTTAHEIEAIVRAAGVDFIDAGIIGGPPRPGESGPIFFVSGSDPGPMLALRSAGLDARSVGTVAGAASALKLSYSGITKGLTTLGALMQEHAREHGLGAELEAVLRETRPELWQFIERAVPGMYPKAYRWIAEMHEIAAYTAPDPAGTQIFAGAAALYERITRELAESESVNARAASGDVLPGLGRARVAELPPR